MSSKYLLSTVLENNANRIKLKGRMTMYGRKNNGATPKYRPIIMICMSFFALNSTWLNNLPRPSKMNVSPNSAGDKVKKAGLVDVSNTNTNAGKLLLFSNNFAFIEKELIIIA
jgi:hypothetical protein